MERPFNVALVGATGAVGQEFLDLFQSRSFPVGDLQLYASPRSAGKVSRFGNRAYTIQDAYSADFKLADFAFFSAGAGVSRELAPQAATQGAIVIDNSSAFRMDSAVPLVVPEINFDSITENAKIIANPNCTAIILMMAVAPLRALGRIDRLIVSTYQSASGGGASVMRELESQTKAYLEGQTLEPHHLPHPYAFNLFSHNTSVNESGYNGEEWKVIQESQKILDRPDLRINITCVRVPVLRAHCESVTVEFAGTAPSEEAVREALSSAPGVRVVDDRAKNHFPMPVESTGQDDVLVGRIRQDISNPNAICMFISGDQLLKGAALNAVQIAERMIEAGMVQSRGSEVGAGS